MVKVSVVIPVYNVEEFLDECLDSIVNQTLNDIEIICVDDGSTDKSLDIINFYAKKDKRIKVFSQKNGGHAVATNKGMSMAKGEYLYLMDSDDWLELTALEETYNHAKNTSADFVMFKSMNYSNDENRLYKSWIYSMDKVADFIGDGVVDYKDLGDMIFEIPVTPWSKLYNHNFIKKIGAKFPEGLIFDDNIFFWDVLFNAKKIAFCNKYLFTRRWYNYSSTTAGDLRFIDSITINNLMIDRFKKYKAFDIFKETLYNRKIDLTYLRFVKIKPEFRIQYFQALQKDYKKIVNDGLYDDYLSVLDSRNKMILNSCLNAESCKEFKYVMANWDAQQNLFEKNKEINKFKDEIRKWKDDFNQIKKDNENLKKNSDKLNKELKVSKAKIKQLENTNNSLNNKNKKLNNEISLYKSSNSWKITKPLRKIKRKM